ncbi:uncharacterized protein LOC143228173 [Tachypleus tridentatus]|uniref:uncharacterized protein LOC143228173 n=1 Tax=Tachypleus tridentatus TaxID=6853 RepID=UPI003FCFA744
MTLQGQTAKGSRQKERETLDSDTSYAQTSLARQQCREKLRYSLRLATPQNGKDVVLNGPCSAVIQRKNSPKVPDQGEYHPSHHLHPVTQVSGAVAVIVHC